MSDISKSAKLSTVYTNHSVRATSITIIDNGGITSRHIMKVSGPRSETSLKYYSNRVSDRSKKEISDVLSNAICANKSTRKDTSGSAKSTITNEWSKEGVSKYDEQLFPHEELLDIFSDVMILEEVDENEMSDPNLNNIQLGVKSPKSKVSETRKKKL